MNMNLPIVLYVILGVRLIGLAIWAGRGAYKERVATKAEQPVLNWVINLEKAASDEDIVAGGKLYISGYSELQHLRDTAREQATCHKYEEAYRRVQSRALAADLTGTPSDTAMGVLQLCSNDLDSKLAFGVDEGDVPQLLQDALNTATTTL